MIALMKPDKNCCWTGRPFLCRRQKQSAVSTSADWTMSVFTSSRNWAEAVCKTVYGCMLCGACDVSCKYNADIELLEALYLSRYSGGSSSIR